MQIKDWRFLQPGDILVDKATGIRFEIKDKLLEPKPHLIVAPMIVESETLFVHDLERFDSYQKMDWNQMIEAGNRPSTATRW